MLFTICMANMQITIERSYYIVVQVILIENNFFEITNRIVEICWLEGESEIFHFVPDKILQNSIHWPKYGIWLMAYGLWLSCGSYAWRTVFLRWNLKAIWFIFRTKNILLSIICHILSQTDEIYRELFVYNILCSFMTTFM